MQLRAAGADARHRLQHVTVGQRARAGLAKDDVQLGHEAIGLGLLILCRCGKGCKGTGGRAEGARVAAPTGKATRGTHLEPGPHRVRVQPANHDEVGDHLSDDGGRLALAPAAWADAHVAHVVASLKRALAAVGRQSGHGDRASEMGRVGRQVSVVRRGEGKGGGNAAVLTRNSMKVSRADDSFPVEYSPTSIFMNRLASSIARKHSPLWSAMNLSSASIVVLVRVSSTPSIFPFFFMATRAFLKPLVLPARRGVSGQVVGWVVARRNRLRRAGLEVSRA